jgi:LacI family transcriptional regulator
LDLQGYHLVLAHVSDERLTDPAFLPGFLRSWLCDGLLIDYDAGIPKRLLDLIAHYRIPAVWINAKLPRCAVHPDDLGAGRLATEALLAAGHECIAYLDASLGLAQSADVLHYSKLDRRDGYLAAMRQAGRKPLLLVNRVDGPLDAYVERTAQRLLGRDAPTAFVAYSEFESRVLGIPLAERGCRLGRDLVGVTFRSESDVQSYPLRTPALLVPEVAMAEAAVRMLLERIDHPERDAPTEAVPFSSRASLGGGSVLNLTIPNSQLISTKEVIQ